jgi:REP element-mobilizing transposase RayT
MRLKGYDYSGKGFYFITLCTKDRRHYFGEVSNGVMILSEPGRIAALFLTEVPDHFDHARVAAYVVMPNHVHLILVLNDNRKVGDEVELRGDGITPGAGPCHGMALRAAVDGTVGTRHGVSQLGVSQPGVPQPGASQPGVSKLSASQPTGVSPSASQFGKPVAGSVAVIINQYKGSVKGWCNNNGHGYFQWQPRYHDHIIRNEKAYSKIVNYIINNPGQWEKDRFHPEGE